MHTPSASARKRPRRNKESFIQVRQLLVMSLLCLPVLGLMAAPVPTGKPSTYPAWWFSRGVIAQSNPTNNSPNWPTNYPTSDDYAAINQGQLKNFATQAYLELQAKAPTSVWSTSQGQVLTTMISGWNPASGDAFAVVNLGQLKTVAKPFYDVLIQLGYSTSYPWTGTGVDDYAVANIGQVKNVFSFDIALDTVAPTFGSAAGIYTSAQTITLSSTTSGAVIYYTTDGSTPVTTGSSPSPHVVSGGTITVSSTVAVKAIAVAPGYINSPVATSVYQITGTTEMIAVGDHHTLALKSDGTVWATGYNGDGELGTGGNADSNSFVKVSGLPSGITAIAAGGAYGLALASDGTVWAWGYGADGELGNGASQQSNVPVQVYTASGPLSGIIALAGGESFAMALRGDGTVWTWGADTGGELGDAGATNGNSPFAVQVSQTTGLTGVIAIAAGTSHALAIDGNGNVWAWGANDVDELGIENVGILSSNVPVRVPSLTGMVSVTAGANYSLALKNDGTVWAWGDNSGGYLGNGFTGGNSGDPVEGMLLGPTPVLNLSGIVAVSSCRGNHSLALTSTGSVWAWGSNESGQLGNGTTNDSNVPIPVSNMTGVIAIAAANSQSTVLKSDGSFWGWGYDRDDSDIGAGGAATQTALPTPIANLTEISAIAAAKSHYLALQNGIVWTWDDTTPGEISDGINIKGSSLAVPVPGLSGITVKAIACGAYFNLALDNNGHVWAWGQNNYGQLGNGNFTPYNETPEPVSGLSGVTITAIACGAYFGMALDSNEHVWTWGYNAGGELGLGDGNFTNMNIPTQIPSSSLSGITTICAGTWRALALKSDGTIWTWGQNYFGELGTGAPLGSYPIPAPITSLNGTTITAIAAGYWHDMALDRSGNVWTWGLNSDGQLGNGTTTNVNTPGKLSSLSGVTAISIGENSFHSLALNSNGLWAWGCNASGQLGVGVNGSIDGISPTGSVSPTQVHGLSGVTVTGLACGKFSTAALTGQGTVLQWGDSSYEPLGFSVPIQPADGQTIPAPTIGIISGTPQTGPSGAFLSNPFVVQVTNPSGVPLPNTVVEFSVMQGSGLIGTSPSGSPSNSVRVTTGPNGIATAYFKQPLIANYTSTISAAAVNSEGQSVVMLTATTPVDTGLPAAPTNLTATVGGSGEIDLTWTNNADNASSIQVQQQNSNGSWTTIANLDPNQNSDAVTNLTLGTNYNFQIVVSNATGTLPPVGLNKSTTAAGVPRYMITDLGTGMNPLKITKSGLVLMIDSGGNYYRWENGILTGLPGNITDMSDDGTTTTGGFIDDGDNLWSGSVAGGGAVGYYNNASIGHITSHTNPYPYLDAGDYEDFGAVQGVYIKWSTGDGVAPLMVSESGIAACFKIADNTTTFSGEDYSGYFYPNIPTLETFTENTATTNSYILSKNGSDSGTQIPFAPTAMNNAGGILGQPQQNGPYVYWNSSSTTLPTGFIAASVNAAVDSNNNPAPQILGIDSNGNLGLLEMDPKTGQFPPAPTDITAYIPAGSPWTSFSAVFQSIIAGGTLVKTGASQIINDDSSIVGTATATDQNGNPILDGNGNPVRHGVLLQQLTSELAVDADRNGTIVMASENSSGQDANGNLVDKTTLAKPFQFWLNNDEDSGVATLDSPNGSEVIPATSGTPNESVPPPVASPDCNSNHIASVRDLEDWTRLWIYTKGLNAAINSGTIRVGLKWKQVTRGAPGIKIVQATDADGGIEYLNTLAAATAQATTGGSTPRPLLEDTSPAATWVVTATTSSDPNRVSDFVFSTSVWTNLSESAPKTFFLFEGASEGEGQLEIVFLSQDGTQEIGEGGSVWIDLRDIKEMYERETSGPVPTAPYNYSLSPPAVNIEPALDQSNSNGNSGIFVPNPDEDMTNPTYIVFVHGYNMTIAGSTNYAETMFKRLWWRGYKGRFAAFRWNTYGNGTAPSLFGNPLLLLPGGAVGTYNDSEFVAWHSGSALKTYIQYLQSLPNSYYIDVVSHSMGSIVVGEAIKEGAIPDHYSILHGAASISCYSTSGYIFPTTNYLGLSPDTSSDPATSSLAYRYAFQDLAYEQPVNFFDTQDSVVGIIWELNNTYFKPQTIENYPISGSYYYYHPLNPSGQQLGFESYDYLYRGLTDFGEARAYADYSLTATIGATPTTTSMGAIASSVNDSSFGNHHSNEFNWTIQQLKTFYNNLMANFGLTPNP